MSFAKICGTLLLCACLYLFGYQFYHVTIADDVFINVEYTVLDKKISTDQYGMYIYHLNVKDKQGIVSDVVTVSDNYYKAQIDNKITLSVNNPQVSSGLLFSAVLLEILATIFFVCFAFVAITDGF